MDKEDAGKWKSFIEKEKDFVEDKSLKETVHISLKDKIPQKEKRQQTTPKHSLRRPYV